MGFKWLRKLFSAKNNKKNAKNEEARILREEVRQLRRDNVRFEETAATFEQTVTALRGELYAKEEELQQTCARVKLLQQTVTSQKLELASCDAARDWAVNENLVLKRQLPELFKNTWSAAAEFKNSILDMMDQQTAHIVQYQNELGTGILKQLRTTEKLVQITKEQEKLRDESATAVMKSQYESRIAGLEDCIDELTLTLDDKEEESYRRSLVNVSASSEELSKLKTQLSDCRINAAMVEEDLRAQIAAWRRKHELPLFSADVGEHNEDW